MICELSLFAFDNNCFNLFFAITPKHFFCDCLLINFLRCLLQLLIKSEYINNFICVKNFGNK